MNIRRRRFWVVAALAALGTRAPAQPTVLYEKASPYNTIVVTEDEQGLRTLRFDRHGPRQSVVKVGDPDHIELPYVRSVCVALALVENLQRVLVVGLGGGTLPSFLHRHYPRTIVDAVDIDPDVIEVARKFFGFREDPTLCAYVADGRKYIEQSTNRYDLIILDAFGSESIPYHLATREFLLAVRRILTPGGLAIGNIWGRSSNPLHDSMVRTYLDVFDQLYILDVPGAGNEILFAWPRREEIDHPELVERATRLSQRKRWPFNLGELVRYGFGLPRAQDLKGRVLRDKPETMVR